jgi:hypothetical protein
MIASRSQLVASVAGGAVMAARRRERLFVLNDPHALRVSAALAMEIGLNESMVLLQLEFLISISDNIHDGRVWTYQSLNDMRENFFPFWSKATIGRAIQALVERNLVIVGNFNRAGFDRTPWYALNPDGLRALTSLRYETLTSQIETRTSHAGTSASQNETSTSQPGTTIPETTSETTPEKNGYKRPTTPEELDAWEAERARTRRFIRALDQS